MAIVLCLFPALVLAQSGVVSPSDSLHWLEVTGVVPDGPAAQAGIRIADVLVSYDGKAMTSRADLSAAQAAVQVDSLVATFQRGNK